MPTLKTIATRKFENFLALSVYLKNGLKLDEEQVRILLSNKNLVVPERWLSTKYMVSR